MPRCCAALIAVVTLASIGSPCYAQSEDDDDGDLIPGLVGTYLAGDETIERVDLTLSHDWGAASPDGRLPVGPFSVTWRSKLLLRQKTTYQFHAYLQGALDVQLDGESVLAGTLEEPGWISGERVELSFGLPNLEVTFQKTAPSAQVHLFWSSDGFPLEPVPPQQLFHEAARPDLTLWEQGRQLYAAHRCNRCHRRDDEPLSPVAPSLEQVSSGVSHDWLMKKLLSRDAAAAHARMPLFGFSEEDAAAVAACLMSISRPFALRMLPAIQAGKQGPPDGDALVKSVGCLACHTIGDLGHSTPFGGGDLSHIGEKRSTEWLFQWLSDPGSLNIDHHMPIVKLTDLERVQIARELATWQREDRPPLASDGFDETDNSLIDRGRQLVGQWRCAACHRIPGQEAHLKGVPSLASRELDWEQSCLASSDRQTHRPVYRNVDAQALKAYVDSRTRPLSPPSIWAQGRTVLEQRNCLACHERDLGIGIVPVAGQVEKTDERFRGQSQALIPPSLTAVGDKLHDKALEIAVRGEQKQPRLPWLQVRMPRFTHNAEDQQALLVYLTHHDRIPADAPATNHAITRATDLANDAEQTRLTGHTLAGAGAFNCVACHKFGDYEPRNVALGTKGCDLLMIGERMRADFFQRWTRAPLRVVPGMEMPNINKPVKGILDDDLDQQLAALWRSINDPRFTTPTNPSQVEQLLIVQPGEPAQIIRDVFAVVPENGGGYVARSFAVGFGNGHGLLLDLDRFAIRGWTLGDFARQRTEGKSWYWDLAGVDVMTGFDAQPGLAIRHRKTGEITQPVVEGSRVAKLLRYEQSGEQIRLEHSMTFRVGERLHELTVTQEWTAFTHETGGASGIRRSVTGSRVPAGYELVLRQPADNPLLKDATITTGEGRHRGQETSIQQTYTCTALRPLVLPKARPEFPRNDATVTTLPGMTGQRLKLSASIMPTSIAITADDRLVFTSLKGHVYEAEDVDGDGLADALVELEQGLASPFGILPFRGGLLVSHKPELLWLSRLDGTATGVQREVWADGWGYSDNYHDWTTGPVQDGDGNVYLAFGSDYHQQGRSATTTRWRGKIIRIDPDRNIEPFAHELRYPQGIAVDGQGRLFVSDQQGVGNTFNEINHIVQGRHYGVKSLHEEDAEAAETRAAVQVPHPWTRSVNGIFFLPEDMTGPLAPFAGHGVGCEYNSKLLIRFSLQEVDGEVQGACYYLSRPTWDAEEQTFLGPICGTATRDGTIYVGSIFDSGWLGGPNTGEIVQLTPNGNDVPNGIRELRASDDGFEIEFVRPVDAELALQSDNYVLSGYTRVWQGSYASPDSGRYTPRVTDIQLSADSRTVRLTTPDRREQYVYELNCSKLAADGEELFPATGHYTMNRVPGTSAP